MVFKSCMAWSAAGANKVAPSGLEVNGVLVEKYTFVELTVKGKGTYDRNVKMDTMATCTVRLPSVQFAGFWVSSGPSQDTTIRSC